MHTRAQREAMKAKGRALSPQRAYQSPIRKRGPRSRASSPLDLTPVTTSPLSLINSGKIVKKNSAPLSQAKKTRTFMGSLSSMAGGLSDVAKFTFNFLGKTVAGTPSNTPPANEDSPSTSTPGGPFDVPSDDMELDHIYDRVQKIDADHYRRFKRASSFASTPQKSRYPRPPLQVPNLSPISEASESSPPKPAQEQTHTTTPVNHETIPPSSSGTPTSSLLLTITWPVAGEQQAPRKFLVPRHVHDQVLALVQPFEVTAPGPERTRAPIRKQTPVANQMDTLAIVKRNIARRQNRSPPPFGIRTANLLGNSLKRLGIEDEVVDALSKTKEYQELEEDWASDSGALAFLEALRAKRARSKGKSVVERGKDKR